MKSVIYLSKEKVHSTTGNSTGHKDIFIAPFTLSMDDHAISFHVLSNRMALALQKNNMLLQHPNWDDMTILYTKIK
jgi:hypothetical protein